VGPDDARIERAGRLEGTRTEETGAGAGHRVAPDHQIHPRDLVVQMGVRWRQIAQHASRERMKKDVPTADVVVTNPTEGLGQGEQLAFYHRASR